MRHDLHVGGYAYRLRPVAESDAAFIVRLRENAGQFLNRGAGTEETQRVWLNRYFERQDDLYFVVETIDGRRREGLIGLYDMKWPDRTAEWGRWVLETGSKAAVESVLLIYRCAFERVGLARVYCRTLAANARVVAFHDSCGLRRVPGAMMIQHNGEQCPAIEHSLERVEWPNIAGKLDRLAYRFATITLGGSS